MFSRLLPSCPRSPAAWCAYVLILVTPGSFLVLPLLWAIKAYSTSQSRG
jgi:Na+-translocating ferredoxin:NAD+ oxidoreductase RnfE subunit